MQNKRGFLFQALMMTAVSFLLRGIGVVSQVMIASKIGAEAVGVSSLIGGVNGFAVTLALSGIQLGATRLVAQALAARNQMLLSKTLRCIVLHALCFGFLSCLLLFWGAPFVGKHWLGDMRTVQSLRIFALSLPFISLAGCFGGYFVAVRRVWKSSCVQVSEECVRILCTLLFLSRAWGTGLESALLALALANALADVSTGLVLCLLFANDCRRHRLPFPSSSSPSALSVVKKLLSVTLPVAISTYARSGLLTLEHMLIPIGLQHFGQSHSASLASYGTLQSMALPVVLFPCALLSSFAGLLIPELTEAHVRRERRRIAGILERVFSLTLIFAFGVSGIMLCFSHELGLLLYGSEEAAVYIKALAPLIPVMYLDHATDAMLKGLGEQVYSMNVNIFDASLSVLLVWTLLPLFGIWGYVITIYTTELINASLSIVRLLNVSGVRPKVFLWVAKPLLCVVLSTLLMRAACPRFYIKTGIALTAMIAATCLIYLGLLRLCGSIKRPDLDWMRSFWKKESTLSA